MAIRDRLLLVLRYNPVAHREPHSAVPYAMWCWAVKRRT